MPGLKLIYTKAVQIVVIALVLIALLAFTAGVFGALSGGAITAGNRQCPKDDCLASNEVTDIDGLPPDPSNGR